MLHVVWGAVSGSEFAICSSQWGNTGLRGVWTGCWRAGCPAGLGGSSQDGAPCVRLSVPAVLGVTPRAAWLSAGGVEVS